MATAKNKRTQARLEWKDAPALLTPPQCARLLAQHVNTINNALHAGKIPFTRYGRHRKILLTDLAGYAGIDLAAIRGEPAPPDLAAYANDLDAAMALPGPDAFEAIQDIVNEMKNEADYGSPDTN